MSETNDAAEVVKIKVDGREIQAPRGKNLLQTLLDEAGQDISFFCYHPGLSIAACCRQCMVRVGGRILPSCQMTVAPDMDVESDTEAVRAVRRRMLEYTLVNHPVDCVMCDKAGECALQRHYMEWDGAASAVNTGKVDKPKKVDIGPEIVLDAERCIMCSRCIRFCAEIAKQPDLVFEHRGDHKVLTTAPGRKLDNPYSLNTVDICPVGALTDKDFRFKIRVWELYATRSVCNGCARGCLTEIHHRDGVIYRLVPPKRMDVNLGWMCDDGRRTYKRISEDRITQPLVAGKPADLEAAVARAAELLKAQLPDGREAIGVAIGADIANEDAFAVARLAFDFFDTPNVYIVDRPDDGRGDAILRRDDPNPNRTGARACARGTTRGVDELLTDLSEKKLKALYVVSDRLELSDETLSQMSGVNVVVQACHPSRLTSNAQVVLPAAKWAEVDATVTNFEGKVQRMRPAIEPPGLARPHWDLATKIGRAVGLASAFDTPRAVFDAMVQQVEPFAGADWGAQLPTQMLRFRGRRG